MAKHHPDLIMCRKQPGVGKKTSSDIFLNRFLFVVNFTPSLVFKCDLFSFFAAIGRLCEKRELEPLTNVMFSKLVYEADRSKNKKNSIFLSVQMAWLSLIDDGLCVICDSYVRPCTLVRICDECNYGSYQGRCTICGGPGVSDAYYCKECTICEKDVCLLFMFCRVCYLLGL